MTVASDHPAPVKRRRLIVLLPLLVFLQGGPGGKAPRPTMGSPPWLAAALKTHRVILPDQRGTGRSTRIEAATMARFADGAAGADYLVKFRADSIVDDFEHVRKTLFGGKRWESLGQSYGGFLTLTYLSRYPDVEASGSEPLHHFLHYGAAEGRDPNRFFDSAWYLTHYPDVAN